MNEEKRVFCYIYIYIDVCLLGHGENGVIYIERREIETELNKKFKNVFDDIVVPFFWMAKKCGLR